MSFLLRVGGTTTRRAIVEGRRALAPPRHAPPPTTSASGRPFLPRLLSLQTPEKLTKAEKDLDWEIKIVKVTTVEQGEKLSSRIRELEEKLYENSRLMMYVSFPFFLSNLGFFLGFFFRETVSFPSLVGFSRNDWFSITKVGTTQARSYPDISVQRKHDTCILRKIAGTLK